jgi:hypothetical protein
MDKPNASVRGLDSFTATATRSQNESERRAARKYRPIHQKPVSHHSPLKHSVNTPIYSSEERISSAGHFGLTVFSDPECMDSFQTYRTAGPSQSRPGRAYDVEDAEYYTEC